MAVSRKNEFPGHFLKISQLAKALSHPARPAIIEFLAKKGPSLCGAIVNELPLSQSTVSQHLKELKIAGLITAKIDGPRVIYSLDDEQMKFSKIYLDRFYNDVFRLAGSRRDDFVMQKEF